MSPRARRTLRLAGLLLLATAGALVYLASVAPPALADNCGTLADCFAVASAMANAASAAATIAPIAMAAGAAGAAGAGAAAPGAAPATAAAQAAPVARPAVAAGAEAAAQARVASALGQAPVAAPPPARAAATAAPAHAGPATAAAHAGPATGSPAPPPARAAPGPTMPGPQAVRALEDVVPPELASDPNFVELWRPGRKTNVMVAVELPDTVEGRATTVRRAAPVRENQDSRHAEDVALRAGDLRWAIAEALQAGSPDRPAVVRVLVNRSPCTSCSPLLATHLSVITSQLTPEQQASIRFEVLSTGAYEANENIPEDEAHLYTSRVQRFSDLTTTTRSIELLLESGWDTRALSRGGVLSERGEWLAGAVDHMRDYMDLPPAGAARPAVGRAAPARAAPVAQQGDASGQDASGQAAPHRAVTGQALPSQGAPAAGALPPPGPPVEASGAPVGGGEPWADLGAAGRVVPAPQTARAAFAQARSLSEQVASLAAEPDPAPSAPGIPSPAMRAAFDASTVAYDAAMGAHNAYAAAYQAAQIAGRVGGPAATNAQRQAEATHALAQQVNAEYQAALAASAAAQQGGPRATQHAARAAGHAEKATSLLTQASDAGGRAVAAAGQAWQAAGRTRTFDSDAAAAEYGRRVWDEILDRLTPGQRLGVSDYSGSFFHTMNRYLRGGIGPEQLDERTRRLIEENVPNIDAALRAQPTVEDTMVVRVTTGAELPGPIDLLVGTVRTNPAYLSTSLATNPRVGSDEDIVMHLDVPAGTPALFMESTYAAEGGSRWMRDPSQELLLGRNTRYVIDNVVSIGGRWHVYGRVLPASRP